MKKNVFICHRPYHILRSCDLIDEMNDAFSENILVAFNVIAEKIHKNQKFETNKIFYTTFNEVVEVERERPPSTRSIINYIEYAIKKKKQYANIVKKHLNADNVFFFCDDELEIEIMVSLFKQYAKSVKKFILVDEGMVTYADTTKRLTMLGKLYAKCLYKLMGFTNLNWKRSYGGSMLYNYSLANKPDKSSFKKPIGQLRPLSESVLSMYRSKIIGSTLVDAAEPYFLYITTSLVNFEIEKAIIIEIVKILEKYRIPFYIKHHPQQNIEPFESYLNKNNFIDKSYPVELYYSNKAIIAGVGSSSLLNASLQGYYVLDMAPLFGEDNYKFSFTHDWLSILLVNSLSEFENHIKLFINKTK